MKKTLVLVFAGILLGSTVAFAAVKVFSDVPSNTWYSEAVGRLADKGIIAGYPDGTFGPTKNVNRAELAVMLDRVIEYTETGSVSYASTSSSEIAFDSCGALSKYENKSWFSSLETKYAAGDYMEDSVGAPYGEGCLSLDETLFIFIPSDFAQAHGCGNVFKYDIANSALAEAPGTYCAAEFGSRIGNYLQFTGFQNDGGSPCQQYSGKYYFEENTVDVSTSAC